MPHCGSEKRCFWYVKSFLIVLYNCFNSFIRCVCTVHNPCSLPKSLTSNLGTAPTYEENLVPPGHTKKKYIPVMASEHHLSFCF